MSTLETRDFNDLRNAFALADKVLMKKHVADIYQYPIKIEPNLQTKGEGTENTSDDTTIAATTPTVSAEEVTQEAKKQEQADIPIKEEPFVNSVINRISVGENVRLYKVEKIVYDKNENVHDKLITVYSSISSQYRSALIILLKGYKNRVEIYMGVALKSFNSAGLVDTTTRNNIGNSFHGLLLGNFPGTVAELAKSNETPKLINKCFNEVKTIAAVSGIATLRNQNESKSEVFVQGMEKLIDSMRGKVYTAIYIADAVGTGEIEALCAQYEDLYAALSPFKQSIHTMNENDSVTDTTSFVQGVVDTTNESVANAVTHGTSSSISKTNTLGGSMGGKVPESIPFIGGLNISGDYHQSKSKTTGENHGETATKTKGTAKSLTEQNSVANAIAKGTGESLQITYDNRAVKTLLDRIDEQIKRLRSCEDFGMFNSCVYFLSSKYEDAIAAASAYKSLIRGENSSIESSAMNVWTDPEDIELLSVYLKRFYHPEFGMPVALPGRYQDEKNKNPISGYLNVTPALMVSGKELAYQFSFPKKSVSGIPVISCAEFGRNAITTDGTPAGELAIGKIYHMHQSEECDVPLSVDALTAHTFITGSTGAGKSNGVYQLLDKITRARTDVSFMVIEPAKGEYKDVFGHRSDVSVYGTNPRITSLLRINPFRFPATTHIYEHMDRLIEIFNVCWPMYAAMPVILKSALEKAYVSAGWDLEKSVNVTGTELFPSFASVATEVRKYLDSSEYSDENKGNYKGALLTRLESLTNGINGLIFTADDLSDEDLYDGNVIIDLSRVGSTETKALIMGILIVRMQEYRSGNCTKNSCLKHITVLEEAHNLLKRTSSEQTSEGSNLIGKSVEMLANSIAEMRTYGEAFMIIDQAPGLLDMSVIRNTNTKIIFRIPDYSDRELVGRAANLNDDQINELAKLRTGVAAVYQNNWITPVLCQFERFASSGAVYIGPDRRNCHDKVHEEVLDIIMKSDVRKKLDDVDFEVKVRRDVCLSKLPDPLKVLILKFLNGDTDKSDSKYIAEIAYRFFSAEETLNATKNVNDIAQWEKVVISKLTPDISTFADNEIAVLLAMLLREHYLMHDEYKPLYLSYMSYLVSDGRVR